MIIVSACLAGLNCKYNGGNNECIEVIRLIKSGKAIPICPEQLGGLATPRPVAEIYKGTGAEVLDGKCRVMRINGEDVTSEFIKGAYETLKIAQMAGAKKAILKSKSPSCGFGHIYDGSFKDILTEGNGVTAELLIRNGISVKGTGLLTTNQD
jgi:uncharacterized protein YbbK (DUF523 family)